MVRLSREGWSFVTPILCGIRTRQHADFLCPASGREGDGYNTGNGKKSA